MCEASSDGDAIPTVFIENERTRVTEWRFPVGSHTGWHVHEFDYVVVPLFDGFLDIKLPGGEATRAELKHGVPYFREKGVEHDVFNGNDFECAFMETEFLK